MPESQVPEYLWERERAHYYNVAQADAEDE